MDNKPKTEGWWNKVKGYWTPAEKQMLLRYALAGGAVGGAGGLLTSYLNHMNEMKRSVDAAEDDPYVNIAVPGLPEQIKQAGWEKLFGAQPGATSLGAAIPVMGLTGISSYLVARKMYQKFKAKEVKRRLQDSEEAYVSSLQDQVAQMKTAGTKEASGPSMYQLGVMGLLGAIPITAMASGYLTNKILDKNFPAIKHPERKRKRFRLVNLPTAQTEVSGHQAVTDLAGKAEDDEDVDADGIPDNEQLPEEVREEHPGQSLMKEASYTELEESDALESLCRTVLAFPHVKEASELPDLIAMAGSNPAGIAMIQNKYGAPGLWKFIKGASAEVDLTDPITRMKTIREACKSAAAPTIELLAASEYNEAAPRWVHTTRHIHPDLGDVLYKHAAVMGLMGRWQDIQEVPELVEELEKMAAAAPQQEPQPAPPMPPSASIPPIPQAPTVNDNAPPPSGLAPDDLADDAAEDEDDSTDDVTPLEGHYTPSIETRDNLTTDDDRATEDKSTPVAQDNDEIDGLMTGKMPARTE